MPKITTNVLVCKQNNRSFYVSVMNSKDLEMMCFVSRKREDPEKGFQRLLSQKRAKDIASYLDNDNGVIPPAIIVSAQPASQLFFDAEKNQITMERKKETLLVLDGQHRLYGLFQAEKDYEIPVVIFYDLNSRDEVRQFIDINTTQKGVPTALLLDIKGQAGTETKVEERQRDLFDHLNSSSVIAGYLDPNASSRGKISRTTFNQATASIFKDGPLANMADEIIYTAVCNYLAVIDEIFKNAETAEASLTRNVMFKAVMTVFDEICEKCLSKYRNIKLQSLTQYLKPLEAIDYSKFTGTNKATEARIIQEIRSELREDWSDQGDLV